ncbi:MAG: heavy metal translocating P-type ATPase [Desulfovibrio sp.]|nr:heavy metal translocating P-type ATPase [Desulfovibrio sp.]
MDCPLEEGSIRHELEKIPGVTALGFDLQGHVLTVWQDKPCEKAVAQGLQSLGMEFTKIDQAMSAPVSQRIAWPRLGAAFALAALAEILELLMPWSGESAVQNASFWADMAPVFVTALAAIVLSGLSTYKKGWLALRSGALNMNALMSVAVTGALCLGQYPEAAMVMVLFNISEALESMAVNRSRKAIKNLLALAPENAVVAQSDGSWVKTDIHQIPVGSRVRVEPGERIALDGRVQAGRSAVNQASITGESLPVEKVIGDTVFAGSINTYGSLEFVTTASATETSLARIIHAVEVAQESRAPVQRLIDVFARYYTPAIFALAILVALVAPLALGWAWKQSLYTGLVLLVIACPCALVISVPVCIVGGMAAATRHGILIKGGRFLELGRKLDCLAMDKTGTITSGKPRLTDFLHLASFEPTAVLAGSLAARSNHPVSRAIAEHTKDSEILAVQDFTALPGRGISGLVHAERWYLGNHSLAVDLGLDTTVVDEAQHRLESEGKTVALLMSSKGIAAILAVADTVRQSSREAVRQLHELGVTTLMLTGDNVHTATAIAKDVGINETRSSLMPEEKLRLVEELAAKGHVVGMVGDGINDAPALARASLGFALAATGTDTAIETADVALMDDDLRKIPVFIRLSRSIWAIVLQNIALALGVKAVFLCLTFAGQATMWMAVFADVGTTMLVVANALRALRQ